MIFNKILLGFFVMGALFFSFQPSSAQATTFHIIGEAMDTLPEELNDNGIVIGKRMFTTFSDPYQDWVYGDKGNPVFQVTRYATEQTHLIPTFWNFEIGTENINVNEISGFKDVGGRNPFSNNELEEQMDAYFYSVVDIPATYIYQGVETPMGYLYQDDDVNKELIKIPFGWKIIDVVLANNQGQLVVKAKYQRKDSNEGYHLGFYISNGMPVYVLLDLTK